ncbi:hypothetical protein F4802DRAFT_443934 [Xylaria palmicola]|nr:hypothetical protein F4802DRAFT_443934 [Xylaria palmicola]
MAYNTNAFWGVEDFDSSQCYTPPALDLLSSPPRWDGFLDFKESIDPKSALELLRGPLLYDSESQDEWLTEFEGLQAVHNRTPAFGVAHCQPGLTDSSSSQHPALTPSSKLDAPPRRSHGGTVHTTSTSTECPNPAQARDLARMSTRDDVPAFYGRTLAPACDNSRTPDHRSAEEAMKGLRAMEQILKTETRRRMAQIEESSPG